MRGAVTWEGWVIIGVYNKNMKSICGERETA